MIEGFIFDLDGTIVDSEPLWDEAHLKIFQDEGTILSDEDNLPTRGLHTFDAVKLLYPKIKSPTRSIQEITDAINSTALMLILEKGKLKPGVKKAIVMLAKMNLPIAIASSSTKLIIENLLTHFKIGKYFTSIRSGEEEEFGKPHPGIFLNCANLMHVDPRTCVVFEDSFNGMIAAKAAKMNLVAFLDIGNFGETKYDFADLKLESFHNFGTTELNYLQSLV